MHIAVQRPHTSPFDAVPTTASAATRQATAASAADDSSSSSSTSSTSTATITANDFLQLLVTELQNQDPTADTDPNEYVDQLVQVNSLQQLIQINQNTDGSTSSTGSSSGSSSSAVPAAAGTAAPPAVTAGHARGAGLHATAHGNLSPNEVHPPNFSAAADQIAGSLAPGQGNHAATHRDSRTSPLSGIALE